jgi:ribosomal protein S3
MGQKVNPIIFRVNQTNEWKSKYIEKKSTELSLVNFNDIEIKKFITQFFKTNGLIIQDLKTAYYNDTLHIFISYFSSLKSANFSRIINKTQKLQLIPIKKMGIRNKKKYSTSYNSIKHYLEYERLLYSKILKQNVTKKYYKKSRYTLYQDDYVLKNRKIRFLKYIKNYLVTKQQKTLDKLQMNFFFNRFLESLKKFTLNKMNISITLSKINASIKKNIQHQKLTVLKKKLVKLRKYEKNDFFKEGINILFLCCINKNTSKLLSDYIATQLRKLKRHNFFLRFVKNALLFFNDKNFSKINGIKIKIKGRFNRSPRARHRFIITGQGVPALTLNSKIDYAESTSFSANGTFGVKVWICEKN